MNELNEMNKVFEEEYGFGLSEAMDKLLDGELEIKDVIESDEFAYYMDKVPHITWKDLERQIEAEANERYNEEHYDEELDELMDCGFTKEDAQAFYHYSHN